MKFDFQTDRPGLLVSVRDETEAIEAMAGGALVIDVKEPARGSLGAADPEVTARVVRTVAGRASVTIALGELLELTPLLETDAERIVPPGVSLFKIGLAGCGRTGEWRARWVEAIERLTGNDPMKAARPVAVVYADWQAAFAPEPEQVLTAAAEVGCPALLIDTWDKSAGPLFNYWPASRVRSFIRRVQASDMAAVLAGSLIGDSFRAAVRLRPHLVAVRSAACEGGRNGHVTRQRVHALASMIADSADASLWPVARLV
jgi:uncharacterized protein (UPF0264 family)